MKYLPILLTFFLFISTLILPKAQVAINTDNANPDSSALLDIKSTDKGFLYPRMSTIERDAITSPTVGLTIFNLDDKCTDIYDGSAWMKDCPLALVPDSLINPWTKKNDFPATARDGVIGFSINGKGYIGTGNTDIFTFKKDFWEYDPSTNTWTQKADLPTTARARAVGFSINGKGYIGTGVDENFNKKKDFWEYDPNTDTWTQKADLPAEVRDEAVGFSINDRGYIGTGLDENSNLKKDFWEYNPSTDTWTQKADFPATARDEAVGFSINDKGYIGTGFDGGRKKDFWEYDPSTDIWTQKADFPGTARARAVGFSINDKGYIGTGFDGGRKKDFWEYNPSTDTWAQKNDFGGTARVSAVGLSINGKGYIGTGADGSLTKDFWEYDPSPTYQNIQPFMNLVSNSTLNDIDNDTKIQVEESPDEDLIRFDVAGREAVNMNDDFPLNIISTPSNRHLLQMFTPSDTAAWHLRLQGTSNKDLGFTETLVADNRLVLAAGGNIGIGIENPNVALDVNGDIEYTGTITDVSDSRLKENLLPISAVLTKLLQLQAYSYNMVDDAAKTREYGLLAQEVQKIFPELVSNIDAEGKYLGLSYIQLIPILVESIKEQQIIINQLTMKNAEWSAQVEELKAKDELHQARNKDFETRLYQLENLLSQEETKQTKILHSGK